jgi:hypothetical protein
MIAQPMMPQPMMPQPMMPAPAYSAGFPVGTPGAQPSYNHDASGLPLGIPTPPGVEVHPSAGQYGMHPDYQPQQQLPPGYPMSPNALYQFQPTQQPPMSLTGQLRLSEIDEIPSQYKIGAARRQWFTYIVSGILAVSVAAAVTFLIIRSTRDIAPTSGTVSIESVPSGAQVFWEGTLITARTPTKITGVQVGTTHPIRVSLAHYKSETRNINIPMNGQPVSILVQLTTLKGTILVNTVPEKAEIWINGQVRGVTSGKIIDVEIESTPSIELRHRDFPPHKEVLTWGDDGVARVNYHFSH